MLKKIAIAGTGIFIGLCGTTPVLANSINLNDVQNTAVFEEPVKVDKTLAENEITVYKDETMTETSGKLFENNIADVINKQGEIIEIKSGELHGYVKQEDVKTRTEAKKEILKEEVKGTVTTNTEAVPVKSESIDLIKPYTVEKEAEEIKAGEEYTIKNFGDKVLIEKDNEVFSVNPEDINIDYKKAEGKTDEVLAAEKKEKEDTEAANAVMDMFDKLADDVELDDKASIEEARNAYNNLTDDQKAKIKTLSSLEEAESELQEKIEEEEKRIEEEKKKEEALKIAEEQAANLASSEDREANAIANADYYNEIAQSKVSYNVDTTGWSEGVASAYGGYSDASVAANARTATGDPVTETTMGVAVPMAWDNFRQYYGHTVLISYGGKTVSAVINDCGNMGGGARSLDLQPGVFRAFGFTNCYDWGLKTVKYKIL